MRCTSRALMIHVLQWYMEAASPGGAAGRIMPTVSPFFDRLRLAGLDFGLFLHLQCRQAVSAYIAQQLCMGASSLRNDPPSPTATLLDHGKHGWQVCCKGRHMSVRSWHIFIKKKRV